jgi:tetratricopeptide (TPR) repeat protein
MPGEVLSLPEKIERYQARLAADPHALVFAQLADAYRKQGRHEEAIKICQEGLSHCANYISAYMVLGRAQKENGELAGAREAFQWVLHLDPESVQAHKFLGQIAEALNEMAEALASYRMALILHPFDKEVRAAVGRLEAGEAADVESISPAVVEARREASGPAAEPPAMEMEQASPEVAEVPPEVAAPAAEPLATETLAGLYATQGLYDRAADIYARLVDEAPDRQDLAEKYREVLTHLEEGAGRQTATPVSREEALQLLEAWRGAFQRLKGGRRGPVGLLEAWRDAFRRLRAGRRGLVELLEAWRHAFRRLKTAKGEGTG